MTYIILYLVIGLTWAVIERVRKKEKQTIVLYCIFILLWPSRLIDVLKIIGDWEI